jgi:hypothetical protein
VRRLLVVPVCALALLCTPGVASADVIFDQADADELAASLAEAYEKQGVCYGWSIDVDNEGVPESSVGSNFGAGQRVQDAQCDESVEFQASISWTPESSESEDSASYQVISTGNGPTTGDLDDLEVLSEDGLVGDDVDVDVYKAVAALPLLAADAGLAEPMSASPAPEAEAGDAQATDSPGSDFWRASGMQVLWGSLILLAGVVFGWYAIRSSRREARRRARPVGPAAEQIPYEPEPSQPEPYEPEPYQPEPYEPEPAGPEPSQPEPAGPEHGPGSESETTPEAAPEPADSETAEPSEKPPGKPPEKPETRPDE